MRLSISFLGDCLVFSSALFPSQELASRRMLWLVNYSKGLLLMMNDRLCCGGFPTTPLPRWTFRSGRLRGMLVGFLLKRVRALVGLREVPKFCAILFFAQLRELLWPVGKELAQAGRLEAAADIFFITLPEARAALTDTDLRPLVQ